MPELTKLTVRVLGDVTDLRSKMSKAEKSVEQFGYNMKRTGKALTAGLTLPIAAVGTAATKMASDAEEAAAKFEVVMGDSASRVRERLEELHDVIPLTRHEMEGLSASVQDLLVPMGVARDRAADMSAEFVSLAGDIGAFNNLHPEQVMNAFMSALAGQTKPVRQFGIDVQKATLEAIALEHGLIDAGEAMDRTAQAQAVLIAITQDSTDAIGAAAAEAENAATQFKLFMRNLKELAVTIGNQLLPVVTPLVKHMNDMLGSADGLSSNFVQWTIAVGAVVAAIGPLLLVLGKLTQTFVALRVAGMAALPIFGVAGALVLGLGALATYFIKNKIEAAAFASELDKIRESARKAADGVKELTAQQALQVLGGRRMALQRLEQQRADLIQEQRVRLGGMRGSDDEGVIKTMRGSAQEVFRNTERAIESVRGTIAGLEDQVVSLLTTTGGGGGGGAGGGVLAARAGLVNSRAGLPSRDANLMRLLAERERRGGTVAPGILDTSIARKVDPLYRKKEDEKGPGIADTLLQPFKNLGPQAMALGAIFEMLKGAMEPLEPVLETLKEPLQQIGHLFGMVLAPVVEVLAFSMKGLMKGVSYVMTAFGWLVEGLGWLIDKLIGWLTDWGDKLQDWGKDLQRTAKSMRDGTHAAEGLADALNSASRILNAPTGYYARPSAVAGGGASPAGITIGNVNLLASDITSDPRTTWQNIRRAIEYGATSGDAQAMSMRLSPAGV